MSNDKAIPSAHDPSSVASSDVADYGEALNSATTVRPAVVARNNPNGYVDPGVPSSSMASGSGEATLPLGDLYADSPPRPFHHNVYEDSTSVFNQEFRDSTPRGRPQRVYGEPHFLHDGFDQEHDELKEMYLDAYRSGQITKSQLREHLDRIREKQRCYQKKRRFVNFANLAEVQRQLMNRSSRAAGAAALGSTVVETNTDTSDSPSVVSSGVVGGTTASFTSTASDAKDASTEDVHNTGFVASVHESPNTLVADSSAVVSTSAQSAESRDCSLDLMCGKEIVTGEDADNFCVQLRFRPRNHVQPAEIESQNASTDGDDEMLDLSMSFAQIGITQEEDVVERIEVDKDSSQQDEASPDSSLATEVAMQQLADLLADSNDSASASNMEQTKDDPMLGEIEDLPDYEDVVRQAQEEADLDEMSTSLANTSFFVEKDSSNAIFESNKPIEAAAEIDEDAEVDGTASFADRTSFIDDHTEGKSDLSNSISPRTNKPEEAPEAMEIDEDAEASAVDQDVEEMEVDGNVEAERTSLPQHYVETSVTVNGPSNSSTLESSNLNEEALSSQFNHSSSQLSPSTSTQIAVVPENSNSEDKHVEVQILDASIQSTQPSKQSQQTIENDVQELSASITPNSIISSSDNNADTEMNQTEKEQNQLTSKTHLQNPSQPSQLVDAEPVQVHISATFADASSNTTSSVQDEQIQELMQQVSSIKKELSRLASIEMELSVIREQRCKCNRAEVPLSAIDSNDQHSLEHPAIAADQHEAPEQPEQNDVVAENTPVLPEIQLRAQMYAATGFIYRRRSKIRVMPGQRSRLALLLPKFKQAMLQRAKQHPNVQVPVNTVDSSVVVEEQPESAATSTPEKDNDQEVANVDVANTIEPQTEKDHDANLDGANTKLASEERQRPRFDGLTAKRLREILARPDTESPMPRYQSPAPFYSYDSDESLARRQREQAEIDAEMKSMDADSQQWSDGSMKDVDISDSDVTVTAQPIPSNDEDSSGSAVSTKSKKRVKRRVHNVQRAPCYHPRQAEIIAHLKSIYMWCDVCNLPYSKRLIMSDDEPTCPSCAEDSDAEDPEVKDRNSDTANNDESETGNATDQNDMQQEEPENNGPENTEAMNDVSDPEVERQEIVNEGESPVQSVDLEDPLSETADIPPPPTPVSISSVEIVQLDDMSDPREDEDNDHDTSGNESIQKRASSNNSTDNHAHDSFGQKRRSNGSDDDEVRTKRPRRQLVIESSSEDEGPSNGGPSTNRRLRPINRQIRRQLGRAMKRRKPPVKPQFGRLHHISELEGINLPRASPVVNMEGLFLDDDTDLSADKQVLVVSGDHFQAVLFECGIVVFIGFFDGASLGSAQLREARLQPVILWHFSEDRIKSIAAGPNHLVLLGRSGRVYTIGCAKQGQLGVPKPKTYRLSSIRPHLLLRRVVVRGEEITFSRILTIGNVTVAVTEEGAVFMCGEGYGSLFRRTN